MEIKVGRYTLKSDKFAMYIDEDYVAENGKKGTRQVAGYCTRMDYLLADFIEKQINDSDAKKLKDVMQKIADATDEAKAIAIAAYKGDFKIVRNK